MNIDVQSLYCKGIEVVTTYGWHILAAIVCCIIILPIFRKKNICISKTENGKIVVTKSALIELIAFVVREIGVTGKTQIVVNSRRNGIKIDIVLRGSDCNNLQELSRALYERLNEVIVEKIGISKISKLNIAVSKFLLNKNTVLTSKDFEEQI